MTMLYQKQLLTDTLQKNSKKASKKTDMCTLCTSEKKIKILIENNQNKEKNIQESIDETEKIFEKNDDDDIEDIIEEQNKADEKTPLKRKITDFLITLKKMTLMAEI